MARGASRGGGTAGLLLAGVLGCSLGPRVSRIRFSGGDGISPLELFLAPLALLSDVIGACGGGAPVVELVYRRCSPAARRPEREVSALGFCFVNREAALGLVEAWRMEQIQSSRGGSGRRRWIYIQGRRSSGRVPGRWIYSVGFTSSTSTSVYCGSFKSFKAMGLQLIRGWRHPPAVADGGGVQRAKVPGSWLYFSVFPRAFVQIVWGYSCPLYSSRMYLYVYTSLYGIFMVNAGTFDREKKGLSSPSGSLCGS